MNITDFLLARIAEDEAALGHFPPGSRDESAGPNGLGWADVGSVSEVLMVSQRRAHAECEAKRRIVEAASEVVDPEPEDDPFTDAVPGLDDGQVWAFALALRALAQPYSHHPDFDPAWTRD